MKVSTTTLIDTKTGMYMPYESIDICSSAGFSVLDFNFCRFCRGEEFMMKSDWQDSLLTLREYAEKKGITFSQSHGYLPRATDTDETHNRNMFIRTIEGTSLLGAKTIVLHPVSVYDGGVLSCEKSMQKNIEDITLYLETAHKTGVTIAIENLFDMEAGENFASKTDNLLELIAHFKDNHLGVCYDFGHGNLTRNDHIKELQKIGRHLKALHVNDNDGKSDQHLLPGFGIIDWQSVIATLKEIDFQGNFTYEAHSVTKGMDESFHLPILKYALSVGQTLLEN